jgi:hypothetical protein
MFSNKGINELPPDSHHKSQEAFLISPLKIFTNLEKNYNQEGEE